MWDCWNDCRRWNKDKRSWGFCPSAQSRNLCVRVCVCLCYFCVCVQVLLIRQRRLASTFSCAFTSGCWWSRGLLAQRPPLPRDSGDAVLGCDCGGERWIPPYRASPCLLAVADEGAPARGGKARGGSGAPLWTQREKGKGRSKDSGCHTRPPSSARTVDAHSVWAPPSPPLRSSGEYSPALHMD